MNLTYTKDEFNSEILHDNDNNQIMMEWEKPYMEKCIDILDPKETVLEIGFGCGYSATKICNNKNVKDYTVIECAPEVWNKFEEFKKKIMSYRDDIVLTLIKGRWQDVLKECKIFDYIFFDDYVALSQSENDNRFNKFLLEILKNHSKIGTKISLYSTVNTRFNLNCLKEHICEFIINIPENCKYAHGNKMYIPLLEKIGECDENIEDKLLKKNHIIKTCNFVKNEKKNKIIIIDNFLKDNDKLFEKVSKLDFNSSKKIISDDILIKEDLQKIVKNFSGNIINFICDKNNNYYRYFNSFDRPYISKGKKDSIKNNWCGILFLSLNLRGENGIDFYDSKILFQTADIEKTLETEYYYDKTIWNRLDYICNRFNRLILFSSDQYYCFRDFYGKDKRDGMIIQFFNFTTEY
jgi:hypothetical protein